MMSRKDMPFDEIGYWSEIKLDILKEYAAAYSPHLGRAKKARALVSRLHRRLRRHRRSSSLKTSGEFIPRKPHQCPSRPTSIPRIPFHRPQSPKKSNPLNRWRQATEKMSHVHHGDCNKVLLEKVLPQAQWPDYRRALCILDPYGLHLDWTVIAKAGDMKSVEIFLNFPVADMNRNCPPGMIARASPWSKCNA